MMMWTGTAATGGGSCSQGRNGEKVFPDPWLQGSLNLDPVDPALATMQITGPRPAGWENVDWSDTVVSGRIVAIRGERVDPVDVVVGWFGDTTEVVAREWLRDRWTLENLQSVTLELDANPKPVSGGVVCLVARRSDGGYRDESWRWVRQRWEQHRPDIPIYVGYDGIDGPYNNSRARNTAAALAGDWDIAIVSDADSICGFDQIDEGVRLAQTTGRHSICFTRFCYLSKEGSRQVMDGFSGSWEPLMDWHFLGGCSSMLAIPRTVWDAAGGMDEGFSGWGWEDVAFSVAMQTMNPHRVTAEGESLWDLRLGFHRLDGDCWHLWHPAQSTNNPELPGYKANEARAQRYADVANDPAAMRALLEEFGVL